jgi:predicted nucleic acid-binding protein
VSPDPDDNYLYALALALMVSDFLASGDPHLLDLRGGPVRVVTPREFLEQI